MPRTSTLIVSLLLLSGLCCVAVTATAQDQTLAPPSLDETPADPQAPSPPSDGPADRAAALFDAFSAKVDLLQELTHACQSLSETAETADVRAGCREHLKTLADEVGELWRQLQEMEEEERAALTKGSSSVSRPPQKGQ